MDRLRWLPVVLALAVLGPAPGCGRALGGDVPLPQRLSATGLYLPGKPGTVDPAHIAFSPQYPLWSDGAAKQRWLSLPPGTTIDASDPDAWVFPVGTRLWKQFSQHGRPVETRTIERLPDGSWRYASYAWTADGDDAVLVGAEGLVLEVEGAPGGRYEVPSRGDCLACHDGTTSPVLGFAALQLSSHRDPLAPHAEAPRPGDTDLRSLVARGLLVNLPAALLQQPPRITARSAEERAALGYLHGNCGHCHRRAGSDGSGVPVDLVLQQSVQAGAADPAAALLQAVARYGSDRHDGVVVPGAPERSLLVQRMQQRNPYTQMPPLGTRLADGQGLALVRHWIATLEASEELP